MRTEGTFGNFTQASMPMQVQMMHEWAKKKLNATSECHKTSRHYLRVSAKIGTPMNLGQLLLAQLLAYLHVQWTLRNSHRPRKLRDNLWQPPSPWLSP